MVAPAHCEVEVRGQRPEVWGWGRHAFYKMVALVQGVNVVKKELGLPLAESVAADPKWSLLRIAK